MPQLTAAQRDALDVEGADAAGALDLMLTDAALGPLRRLLPRECRHAVRRAVGAAAAHARWSRRRSGP